MHQMVLGGVSLSRWSSSNPFRLCRLRSTCVLSVDSRVTISVLLLLANSFVMSERAEMLSHIELGYLVADAFGDQVSRIRAKRKRELDDSGKQCEYQYQGLSLREPAAPGHVQVSLSILEKLQHQLSSLYSQVKEERQAKGALSVKLGLASTSYEVARTRDACAVEAEVSQQVAQQVALERSRTLSSIREICDAELDKLGQSTGCFKLTADVADSLTGFSISEIQSCFKIVAPLLTHILSIGDSEPNRGSVVVRELRCVTLMSVLAKQKGMRLLMFQLLLSLMCFARAVSRPVLDTLNRIGICMSYQRTLDWLKEIAKKTTTKHQFEKGQGQWLLVYDNVNFQKKIRHERLGRKGESWNFTSRLAAKINRLPPADLVAKGNKSQCSRSSLLPESILPSDEDEDAFFRRCLGEIKTVMVKYFKAFEGLLHQVSDSRSLQSSQKSTIIPLSLMQIDESVIDNNIDILLDSAKILSWTGSEDHCVVGDQAT